VKFHCYTGGTEILVAQLGHNMAIFKDLDEIIILLDQ
jgi:hypothetical protein